MNSQRVEWKVDLYKADPQKVYEEIGEDTTTPEEVLEKAKDPNSELHKCFEWDDTKAAEKYRLQQSRQIMCNLVFVTEDDEEPVRVMYKLTMEKSEYHPTKLILKQPDQYAQLLQQAKGELDSFKKKYKILKELKSIFDAIDEL